MLLTAVKIIILFSTILKSMEIDAKKELLKPNEELEVHLASFSLFLRVGVDTDLNCFWYELWQEKRVLVSRSNIQAFSSRGENLLGIESDIYFQESETDETWEQIWGEDRFVQDFHRELFLETKKFNLRFRLFEEGLGFRYELKRDLEVEIKEEKTEFNVEMESEVWWIPALGGNHYEHPYRKTLLEEVEIAHTPFTIELKTGGFLSLHEAALYNFGAMNVVASERGLLSSITPLKNGTCGIVEKDFKSPWRTIVFAEEAFLLPTSRIMLNLNEPSKIKDTTWIKPAKFMGIWWGMFIKYFTWESGDKHGATTANAFRYINACKRFGIKALLIEGWNVGWDGDWTKNGDKMDLMLPYPDFDIHAVTAYAKSQGVEIIGHHETSGNIAHYEWQLPEAYDYYKHFGVKYIKTGYVNSRLSGNEFHSSQVGVNHFQKTVELSAERKIMLDIHEPVKGTGIERTWPNLLTREGVMGQEYEGGAVPPEHATVLPFTRLLSGPLDYTPGLFNLKGTERKVQTTLAKQLAFYVVLYSPLQMVADLPEHYEGNKAFQFISDVPTDWEETKPLAGVIGDYYVVARKDRNSEDWYLGAVSDEEKREIEITLDFLPRHKRYLAIVYRDADSAHYKDDPEALEIEEGVVKRGDKLILTLAAGGGCAIRFKPQEMSYSPYPNWSKK